MHFKLLIAFVEDNKTEKVMDAARKAGATGATVINNARGEGLLQSKTFFGLSLETQRDVLMFLVEEHLSRSILEKIGERYVAQNNSPDRVAGAVQAYVADAGSWLPEGVTLTIWEDFSDVLRQRRDLQRDLDETMASWVSGDIDAGFVVAANRGAAVNRFTWLRLDGSGLLFLGG